MKCLLCLSTQNFHELHEDSLYICGRSRLSSASLFLFRMRRGGSFISCMAEHLLCNTIGIEGRKEEDVSKCHFPCLSSSCWTGKQTAYRIGERYAFGLNGFNGLYFIIIKVSRFWAPARGVRRLEAPKSPVVLGSAAPDSSHSCHRRFSEKKRFNSDKIVQ